MRILATSGGDSVLPEKGHKEPCKVLEMCGGYRCKSSLSSSLKVCLLYCMLYQNKVTESKCLLVSGGLKIMINNESKKQDYMFSSVNFRHSVSQ